MTSHSADLVADQQVDPAEVLVLRATSAATSVTVGSEIPELVEAARADMPLSPHIEALTRPPEYSELAGFGTKA